jgi:hypothetical protein
MKKIILFIVAIFFASQIKAQINLVPNPSFEIYDTCPNYESEVYRNANWMSFGGSSDYFNSCSQSWNYHVGVPKNVFGFQKPASGNAYCGLLSFVNSTPYINLKEFIGCQLINPLSIGEKYFLSFKISLSDSSHFATNKIGALFTNIKYSESFEIPIQNHSTIFSSQVIVDTSNWVEIFGSFISDSSYKYIVIGNFFTDSNTIINRVISDTLSPFQEAYYYVDDVCISTDSTYAYNYIYNGINELLNNDNKIFIIPNPSSKNIFFQLPQFALSIEVKNILGQSIFWEKVEPNISNYTKDISMLPNGVYLLVIKTNSNSQVVKFIKQ